MRRNTAPNVPKLKAKPTTFVTEKDRSRNNRSGTRGERVRSCQPTNAITRREPSASSPTTDAESHPSSLPRTIACTRASTPPPARTAPTTSMRARSPNALGRAHRASGIARTATGTLSQKIACQFHPSMTAPPTSGPTATPRPEMPPQMPMARGRRSGATAPLRRARDSGMTPAAPSPWTARAAINWAGSTLSAASTDPTPKATMPTTNAVRRPKRSPRAEAMRMRLAKASVYALTNHCSSSMLAPSSRCRTGRALVMTRLSRVAMNIGREAAITTQTNGRDRGRVFTRLLVVID